MKQHPGRWFKPRTLLKYSNVRERDYRNLKVALIELYQDGQIDQKGRRQYAYRPKQQERTGVLSITTRGFGFVELKDGSEVFIRSQDMLTALHGDLVRVRISSRRSEMKRSGRIIEVIKRQQTQFVGTYKRDRYSEWVLPSDKKVRVRFRVDRVKPPGPGPISIMFLPSISPAMRTIRSVRFPSRRKCWPKDFRASNP